MHTTWYAICKRVAQDLPGTIVLQDRSIFSEQKPDHKVGQAFFHRLSLISKYKRSTSGMTSTGVAYLTAEARSLAAKIVASSLRATLVGECTT